MYKHNKYFKTPIKTIWYYIWFFEVVIYFYNTVVNTVALKLLVGTCALFYQLKLLTVLENMHQENMDYLDTNEMQLLGWQAKQQL